MLSPYDARQVENQLIAQRRSSDLAAFQSKEVRLSLVNIDTGIKIDGSEPLPPGVFTSAEYLQLKMQAQFYRGDISYGRAELPFLKKWISSNNPELLRELFLEKVIKWLPSKQRIYHGHVLDHVFKEASEAH